MNRNYDIIIIGGGIIGTASAYYLSGRGMKVLLLEKNFLTAGSTGRCISGVRQQFSSPTTIQLAMTSVRLFKILQDENVDIEWKNSGYLFLAYSEDIVRMLKKNITIQQQYGLDVSFITPEACKKQVPLLNADNLIGAAWCGSDGQANPFLTVKAYADGTTKNGGTILIGEEVSAIKTAANRIESVTTTGGEVYSAPAVLNAAGPWAECVNQMVGLSMPLEPERHEALITEGVEYCSIPMLVDYRPDGGYFMQRVTGQFIGCFTPKPNIPGRNIDSSLDFLADMSSRMVRLVPAIQHLAVLRQWAGSYTMTPDGSPILGQTEIDGFYCAVGMNGHGFMLGPAIGQAMAQYITEKQWPIPLAELEYGRNYGKKEDMA